MNVEPNILLIIQISAAMLITIGFISLLYWLLENPVLEDDEMREVLEQTRYIRQEALRKSRVVARQESERLYRV